MDSLDSQADMATFSTDEDRATNQWWSTGNDLALVEAIRNKVRGDREAQARLNSHLVGAARVAGLSQEEIEAALDSYRDLTIYEP